MERNVCPSITSDQILSGPPIRFAADKRTTRDVISVTESKPNEWRIQSLENGVSLSSLGKVPTASLRCAVRFPVGTLDEPGILSVQEQVTGAWLNGKPLEKKASEGRKKEFQITKDLTFGNDDANLLVVQIDFSRVASNLVVAPTIKTTLGSKTLNGNWEVRPGSDESARNIPLPAKFGMSPEVFFTLP